MRSNAIDSTSAAQVEHHARWEPFPRRINKESVSMVIFVSFGKRPLLSLMERIRNELRLPPDHLKSPSARLEIF